MADVPAVAPAAAAAAPLPASLALSLLLAFVGVAAFLSSAPSGGGGGAPQSGAALSLLHVARPASPPDAPAPSRGRVRPAPAASAENSEWIWTAVFRGNASRPPHLAAQWTAQVGQDRTIVDIFGGKRDGFFLDLAANDAAYLSNTLTLERDFGWRGICVEANPGYARSFAGRSCRLAQAVVGPRDNERVRFVFEEVYGGVVGFDQREKDGGTELLTVSVARLLDDFGAPPIIDYLSLDIEGAEWWAFSTFPWHRYVFLTITIERPSVELQRKLVDEGYVSLCVHGSFGDELFVHESIEGFDNVVARFGGRAQCRS